MTYKIRYSAVYKREVIYSHASCISHDNTTTPCMYVYVYNHEFLADLIEKRGEKTKYFFIFQTWTAALNVGLAEVERFSSRFE